MSVAREKFGEMPDGTVINVFVMENSNGMKAKVIEYGGILVSLEVPDRDGKSADVTLGFDTLDEYVNGNAPFFGALVGRYGNRIGDAKFSLEEVNEAFAKAADRSVLRAAIVP